MSKYLKWSGVHSASSTVYDDVLRHPSPESSQQSAPQEQIQQQSPEQHEAQQEAEPLLVIGRGIYTLPMQTCVDILLQLVMAV